MTNAHEYRRLSVSIALQDHIVIANVVLLGGYKSIVLGLVIKIGCQEI
jgi:hypothetical protein